VFKAINHRGQGGHRGDKVVFLRVLRVLCGDFLPKNENVPDSKSHGTLVEQPSPEVCSQTDYCLWEIEGMARLCYFEKPQPDSNQR